MIQASSSSSSSGSGLDESSGPEGVNATAVWIDENVNTRADLDRTIAFLTELTLSPDRADRRATVAPLSYSLDEQLWPWNRAASRFVKKAGAPEAAAEVNAAMYLAIISLQVQYRLRFHKGMPLCNIGFFIGRTNQRLGVKAWLLGVAEDAFSDRGTLREALNFRNLLGSRIQRPALEQYVSTIESRYLGLGVLPLLPELVPDFWLDPFLVAPTKAALVSVRRLEETVAKSYPLLPQKNLALLEEVWSFIRLPEGVVQ
jgi:hypothetical protein